jgi:hypothetical protein
MPMPEASMNKNHGAVLRQNDIRSSRQIASMQTESKSEAVQNRTNGLLWLRVTAFDSGHVGAALLRGQPVHDSLTSILC